MSEAKRCVSVNRFLDTLVHVDPSQWAVMLHDERTLIRVACRVDDIAPKCSPESQRMLVRLLAAIEDELETRESWPPSH